MNNEHLSPEDRRELLYNDDARDSFARAVAVRILAVVTVLAIVALIAWVLW